MRQRKWIQEKCRENTWMDMWPKENLYAIMLKGCFHPSRVFLHHFVLLPEAEYFIMKMGLFCSRCCWRIKNRYQHFLSSGASTAARASQCWEHTQETRAGRESQTLCKGQAHSSFSNSLTPCGKHCSSSKGSAPPARPAFWESVNLDPAASWASDCQGSEHLIQQVSSLQCRQPAPRPPVCDPLPDILHANCSCKKKAKMIF